MQPIETILVPTDFSAFSVEALRFGRQLAETYGARLHLVHAVSKTFSLDDAETLRLEKMLDARQMLYELMPESDANKNVHRHVLEGSPAQEIVKYAEQQDVDLIVIGTHGRTGVARGLLGSVAEKVMRLAPCPLLVVRPRLPEKIESAAGANEVGKKHQISEVEK